MTDYRKKYPYLYETHLHTSQVSACAGSSGSEMAKACKKAGYAGMIVTDHNWGGNTAVNRRLPWKEWVVGFCKGYEDAKNTGDKIGLDVFFGWEAGYAGTEFLIYGLSPQWLLAHPEIRRASVEEQYILVKEGGGMVIHAHPFREEYYIPKIRLFPEYVDGVEVINATHSNPSSMAHFDPAFDKKAADYAGKHEFFTTAGSDIHTTRLLGGGMAFSRKLTDIQDFIKAVCNKEDYVLTDGVRYYEKTGRELI